MLLVIDVGNTNTVLGVFARAEGQADDSSDGAARYGRLAANWRVGSHLARTVDEYGVIFRNLFSMENLEVSGVHGIVISSVVPSGCGAPASLRTLLQNEAAVYRAGD